MNLLPFGKLPPAKPRSFLPPAIDLGDWPQVAPLFDQLERQGAAADDGRKFERWLLDWSELSAALDEEAARMIQYQQSYQAAGKMMQIAQNIFDTLIQSLGR